MEGLIAVLLTVAYLIGSIPWAVWISKLFYGVDVRDLGSRNAGATNTFRTLGKAAGTAVLILDVAKGIAAVLLAGFVRETLSDADYFMTLQVGLALLATLGHIYPVLARFKGGKGVATLAGAVFIVLPNASLAATAVFLAVFFISHYISLSSILASVTLVIAAIFIHQITYAPLIGIICFIPVLILFTHRTNIQRLLDGNENKMYLRK